MTVAGKTFPQLDEAIMGMKIEEMKNLTLTFPAGFQEKDWAGKTLACKLSINSITAVAELVAKVVTFADPSKGTTVTPTMASSGRHSRSWSRICSPRSRQSSSGCRRMATSIA